jgi:hypothetical protein
VSIAAISLCVASQRVFIFVVLFITDSVGKILGTTMNKIFHIHTFLTCLLFLNYWFLWYFFCLSFVKFLISVLTSEGIVRAADLYCW